MKRTIQLQQHLPNIIALYGYGSSFINQKGYSVDDKKKAMDDYIAIVEDVKEFHLQNFDLNSNFYTENSIKYFQNTPLEKQNLGTSLSFLSNLKYPNLDKKLKIGVISKKDFLEELSTWKSLALVGRFSKIIVPFKTDKDIQKAINQNQKNVLIVSLLLMNPKQENTVYDVIQKICELSYIGDVRKLGFEDPNKIKNIVYGNWSKYFKMYGKKNKYYTFDGQSGIITIDYDTLLKEIPNLPICLKEQIKKDNCQNLSQIQKSIYSYIKKSNQKNTVLLAYKGLRILGISSSLNYVSSKVFKYHKAKIESILPNQKTKKLTK